MNQCVIKILLYMVDISSKYITYMLLLTIGKKNITIMFNIDKIGGKKKDVLKFGSDVLDMAHYSRNYSSHIPKVSDKLRDD